MNRRNLLRTLATTAFLAATALFNTGTAAAKGEGVTPPLSDGESFRYDKGLKVTFMAVTKDNRCPINAICTSPGDAEILLRIKVPNKYARNYKLHTNRKPRYLVIPASDFGDGMAGIPKSYVIKIAQLNPLPFAGKETKQSDYRLKLHISVAQ